MQIIQIIASLCAFIVMCVCLLLIFDRKYPDRLLRRLGLSLIFFAAFGRAANIMLDNSPPISNIGTILWIGLSLFLSKHYYSFLHHKNKPDSDRNGDAA